MNKEKSTSKYEIYLGSNIELLNTVSGMTQRQLADKLGVDPSYISRLEKATEKQRPSLGLLVRVSETFEVDLETLVKTDLRKEFSQGLDKYKGSYREASQPKS